MIVGEAGPTTLALRKKWAGYTLGATFPGGAEKASDRASIVNVGSLKVA